MLSTLPLRRLAMPPMRLVRFLLVSSCGSLSSDFHPLRSFITAVIFCCIFLFLLDVINQFVMMVIASLITLV